MRPIIVCAVTVILVIMTGVTAVSAPVPERGEPLPIYPNSNVTLEINATDRDLIPIARQMLPIVIRALTSPACSLEDANGQEDPEAEEADSNVSGGTSSPSPMEVAILDPSIVEAVERVLQGLEQVSVAAYSPPAGLAPEQLSDFYMQKLGLTKGWGTTIRLSSPDGLFRLYTKPELRGVFALVMGKGNVIAVRTEGEIDPESLGKLGGMLVTWFGVSSVEVQTPEATAEPAPEAEAK